MNENTWEISVLDQPEDDASQSARAANPTPTAGLSFTNAGNNLIYCDNPEAFGVSPSTLACMWGASVGTAFKDVELYTNIYNGFNNNSAYRFGIAVQNTTGSAVTITYKYAGNACFSDAENGSLSITGAVQRSFLTASTKTKSIPAGSTAILDCTDKYFKTGLSAWIYFHGCLKASVSSGVYLRVFIAGANQVNNIAGLFQIPVASWGGNLAEIKNNLFCGEVSYSQKNCTMDASSGQVYVLNEWPSDGLNSNEYTRSSSYINGGLNVLTGNYGVIYRMNIRNASNKKIRITPYWTRANAASLVVRFNGGSWEAVNIPYNGCIYRSLGSSSTQTVEMMLPGGNFGNNTVDFF